MLLREGRNGDPYGHGSNGQALMLSRRISRSRRRSRSDSPPQMPNRSSLARAASRHSARTEHPVQTRLASRVEPPFSGKNASGSVSAQSASSRQSSSGAERAFHGIVGIGSSTADESVTRLRKGREKEDTGSSSERDDGPA